MTPASHFTPPLVLRQPGGGNRRDVGGESKNRGGAGRIVDVIRSTIKLGAKVTSERVRRPHNQLKAEVQAYLLTVDSRTASLTAIRGATEPQLGYPPQSSYRSALQDERYFERVARGVFRAIDSAPLIFGATR